MDQTLIDKAAESVLWTNSRVQLTIPSVLARGEEFSLRISVFGADGLPWAGFDRAITFQHSPGIENLPKSVRLSREDNGQATFDGLRAKGPDYAFITARPEGCPQKIVSNPAWVFEEPPYRIFWGDIHVHTTYSNCSPWACKDPEFCYAYARDAACLDFAAAADHLRGIASDTGRWPRLQDLVRQYDAPGRFVTFLGFESSHKSGYGGDINAYYQGADGPHFWLDRKDMRGTSPTVTLEELWAFLDSTNVEYLTIPHHTGRAAKYRSYGDPTYDAKREPLFEIYSGWGSSENRWNRFPLSAGNSDEPAYFQDALKAGCRYGVIASSDDHCTLPGGEPRARYAAGPVRLSGYRHRGLAAVRTHELTRERLWNALKARNCYGTTLARTLLDFRMGEAQMGQEVRVSRNDPLRKKRIISVDVLTTDPAPTDVVLVRNGRDFAGQTWNLESRTVMFEDTEDLDKIAIRDARFHPEPFAVYYVRVEGIFNQTQWSSPIWLDL